MSRRDRSDVARELLAKAVGDEAGLRALVDHDDVPDHVAGFLAQQAVEKSLKAVLMKHGVHYERSHDLDYLCDLIEDGGFEPPESLRSAVAFTPWAARFRYEGPFDPPALERAQALRTVVSIREWATKAIGGGEATETDRVSTSDVETSTPDE